MREDPTGNDQPLDRAGTRCNLMPTEVAPAPMREDTIGNAQPLDLAGTIQTDRIRVPAPRLELGTP